MKGDLVLLMDDDIILCPTLRQTKIVSTIRTDDFSRSIFQR